VGEFARAGADVITVHVEATAHLHYVLSAIREAGCAASVSLCPATPVSALDEVADDMLDMALCMSVNPGWGGQSLIPRTYDKLRRMRSRLPDAAALEVDGGVHKGTAAGVADAGANVLVAGSAVFTSDDPGAAYADMVAAAGAV
jgi:ribulose-phosphate 3-epimerase